MDNQLTPEKALADLWKQKQTELINKHIIPMYASLRAQSIKYFLKDGTVSGSFRQALEDIMNDTREFVLPKPGNKIPDWMEHFKPPFTHSYTSVLNADRNIVLIVRGCDHLSNKLSDLEVMSVTREEMAKTIADILNKLAGKQNLKMK